MAGSGDLDLSLVVRSCLTAFVQRGVTKRLGKTAGKKAARVLNACLSALPTAMATIDVIAEFGLTAAVEKVETIPANFPLPEEK